MLIEVPDDHGYLEPIQTPGGLIIQFHPQMHICDKCEFETGFKLQETAVGHVILCRNCNFHFEEAESYPTLQYIDEYVQEIWDRKAIRKNPQYKSSGNVTTWYSYDGVMDFSKPYEKGK